MEIDLNADVGESFGQWTLGDDEAILDVVTSANVACGFHAGDPLTLLTTCRYAASRGVSVGAQVSYNDPYFPMVGKGRKYDLQMKCTPLENLGQYDCVLIVTDHSDYDYGRIVRESQLVVDTRNATKGVRNPNVVRC